MTTLTQNAPRLDPHLVYALDAVASAAVGAALLVLAEPLTQLAGWSLPSGFLWTVGLLLLLWAALNVSMARTARPPRGVVLGIIAGDVAWVAGSAVLLLLFLPSLTTIGAVLLAGQGIAVAGVLALKLMGARAVV